ncbi:MAG: hypothetical protein V4760_16905 [Bdellovibrionota bacterium]
MTLRRVLTALIALAIVQAELATAATAVVATAQTLRDKTATPLKAPQNKDQAIALIRKAEQTAVASYFSQGDVATNSLRFQTDLIVVAKANELVGIVDQADGFRAWWARNSAATLKRRHLGQPSLQGFFSEVYLLYKIEATNAKDDPSPFIAWLADHVSNPTILNVSKVTFGIFSGVLGTITQSFKNALTFAIVAGIASALVEPAVRPIREKAAQIGSKYLGRIGMLFNRVLFTNGALADTQDAVNSAKSAHKKARDLFNNMGYDMTVQQYEENFMKLKEAWNAANQVWLKTNPEAFRNGRNIMNDGIVFRTQHFSLHAMVSVNGAETQRQGYEATIDRIAEVSSDKPGVHKVSQDILSVVEKQMSLERETPDKAKAVDAEIAQLKTKLMALGATQAQADRIVSNRRRELANYRHTATSLAAAVINDLQYEEFNRAMPREVYDMYGKLKSGFSINFFHKEFAKEIVAELDRLGFQVDIKGEQVAAEIQKRRSTKQAAKPVEPPSPKSKLKSVLGRLGGSNATKTAAAREGTLDKTGTESVRDSVRRARK